MGTWGISSFENDEALDWLGEVVDCDSAQPIADALLELIECQPEDRGAAVCDRAIAAAEIVAATWLLQVVNVPIPDGLPEDAAEYVTRMDRLSGNLNAAAVHSVKLIREQSELRDQWSEDQQHLKEWLAHLDSLLNRLPSVPDYDARPAREWVTPDVILVSGFKPTFKDLEKDVEKYLKQHGPICRDEYPSYAYKKYEDSFNLIFHVYLDQKVFEPLVKHMKNYDWAVGTNQLLDLLTNALVKDNQQELVFEVWSRVLKRQSAFYRTRRRDAKKFPDDCDPVNVLATKAVLLQTLARLIQLSQYFERDDDGQYWRTVERLDAGKNP